MAQQLNDLCMAGGFPLAQWKSNHPDFLPNFSPTASQSKEHSFDDSDVKILGLSWLPQSEKFLFTSNVTRSPKVTKRTILSELAQLYDPLGFISLLIIKGKILLQQLWLEKLVWDDQLSPPLAQQWTRFRQDLNDLSQIRLPRWLNVSPCHRLLEIHGFSDASQLAISAVVHLKVTSEHGTIINLVCSKTKVAPLKPLTIPRLELSAAALLTKLTRYVVQTLQLLEHPIYLWTDSSVALTWILCHPSRWKDLVHNRVSLIQDALPLAKWLFVPGKENPADCASRGLTSRQLSEHTIWCQGPTWLIQPAEDWPSSAPTDNSTVDLDKRPGLVLAISQAPPKMWNLCDRYSSLSRLLRVTATCQRVASITRSLPNSSLAYLLYPSDLFQPRHFWIQATQLAYFSYSIKLLSHDYPLPRSQPLSRLTPFLDRSGILRISGRLKNSQLDSDSKHPIILPKTCSLSRLLIADAHLKTLDGGTQATLSLLQLSFWIIGGRTPVRSYILKCVRCARHRGIRAQHLMGQLSATRASPSSPFSNTGVDYASPLSIKTLRGRCVKLQKGWLARKWLFSCASLPQRYTSKPSPTTQLTPS